LPVTTALELSVQLDVIIQSPELGGEQIPAANRVVPETKNELGEIDSDVITGTTVSPKDSPETENELGEIDSDVITGTETRPEVIPATEKESDCKLSTVDPWRRLVGVIVEEELVAVCEDEDTVVDTKVGLMVAVVSVGVIVEEELVAVCDDEDTVVDTKVGLMVAVVSVGVIVEEELVAVRVELVTRDSEIEYPDDIPTANKAKRKVIFIEKKSVIMIMKWFQL